MVKAIITITTIANIERASEQNYLRPFPHTTICAALSLSFSFRLKANEMLLPIKHIPTHCISHTHW